MGRDAEDPRASRAAETSGSEPAAAGERSTARAPALHGDVRARRRHLAHERVDLRGGSRSGNDRERGPGGDRTRSAGVGRVHPDRQQGWGSDRTQAGLRAGPAGLCDRRHVDGLRPEPDIGHPLLGHHRWARGLVAASRHAVPDPRQLRRGRSAEGLRAGRRRRGDRRRRRTAARRLHHHVSVVAGGVPPRGRRHRDRAVEHQTRSRRRVHRRSKRRRGRRGAVRPRHGRHRAGHPLVAGGRGVGRRPHRRSAPSPWGYWSGGW